MKPFPCKPKLAIVRCVANIEPANIGCSTSGDIFVLAAGPGVALIASAEAKQKIGDVVKSEINDPLSVTSLDKI